MEAYWRRTSAAALLGAKPETVGWGGRIRTSAWRNQNPLPYRLATPQQKTGLSARLTWCFGGAQVHALIPEKFEHIRDSVAIRLGDEFCRWAYLPDKAEDVAARVDGARPTWTDEIATMQDIPDAGDAKTYTSGFASLDQHGLRIVLPAFMPIIGPYASGESVLLRQLLFNLWRLHKWKFLLTSFEENVKPRYQRDFRRHLIGRPMCTEQGEILWSDSNIAKADIEREPAQRTQVG